MAVSPPHGPIDLVPLRAATGAAIAWYEAFLAGRPRSLAELNAALEGLRGLPPMGGQLGRAVAIVAAGGSQATTEETIAALETLCSFAGLRRDEPVPPAPAPAGPVRPEAPEPGRASTARPSKRRGQNPPWSQPTLPGIDHQ